MTFDALIVPSNRTLVSKSKILPNFVNLMPRFISIRVAKLFKSHYHTFSAVFRTFQAAKLQESVNNKLLYD